MQPPVLRLSLLSLLLGSTVYAQTTTTNTAAADNSVVELETVYATAEQQIQQSLGVSHISRTDIDRSGAVNDIADLVRTMPGVNLTGNTATGQRGNKRQIDLRGMGPENTLILIDGKPVTSRNSARISMRGERNTTGDSNWVPLEAIESVEVIRGPATARYGSGAMGGVVNITTKKITNEYSGSVTYYTNQPDDSDEGATNRVGFTLSGPIVKDTLAFRLYGNINKTEADSPFINQQAGNLYAAGVEGVKNKDLGARLDWQINPNHSLTLDANYSRQGNIYNGDTQNSNGGVLDNFLELTKSLYGKETQRLYRRSFSLTHNGHWGWGDSKTWLSYENTVNSHIKEALSGKTEGAYNANDPSFVDSELSNFTAHSEAYIPFSGWGEHVLTLGGEVNHSKLQDPGSILGTITGSSNTEATQTAWALFAEDNWEVTHGTTLIPTIRLDHDDRSGYAVSGGFNIAQQLGEYFLLKGGIARAYKAPNLYQTNPNFTLSTKSNGCPIGIKGPCYLLGNDDLKPEYSWNKEIGIEFTKDNWQASLTYFHNRYSNKITASDYAVGLTTDRKYILQWVNTPKATIAGLEGNLVVPLHDTLKWSNNFTYMSKSEDYLGNPLSLTPKYTVNSTLSWTPNENWDANVTYTHFGSIKPRTIAVNNTEDKNGLSSEKVDSYGLVGVNVGYTWKHGQVRAGISNLFDKKLYRTANGAQTFNQHGRAYYASLRLNF